GVGKVPVLGPADAADGLSLAGPFAGDQERHCLRAPDVERGIRKGTRAYFTPPIRRLTGREIASIINPIAIPNAPTYPKSLSSGIARKKDASRPPRKFPTEMERKNTPIVIPAIRLGASLVMALNPTGLKHSSPMVCSR